MFHNARPSLGPERDDVALMTAGSIDTPSAPRLTENLERQRLAFYGDLGQRQLGALWNVLNALLTPEPRVRAVPHIWPWRDVRPCVIRSGELVTAEEAERRVLYFLNPALPPELSAVTNTLYAGIQLILPGEIARTHHHTPSAIRSIEGEHGYTSARYFATADVMSSAAETTVGTGSSVAAVARPYDG
jgi:hypothetical protein